MSNDECDWDAENYEQSSNAHDEEIPSFAAPSTINIHAFTDGLGSLTLFSDNPNFTIQAFNLAMVDKFIMDLEIAGLQEQNETEKTPESAIFLSAQTQLWLFGLYEILRTWRQRARDLVQWSENNGLDKVNATFQEDVGYKHFGRELRVAELQMVKANPDIVRNLQNDLKRTQMLFSMLETIRVNIAKHEHRKKKNSAPYMPQYARLNRWCGSLDYELGNDYAVIGYMNRRNFADRIRSLATDKSIPSKEELDQFEKFLEGPSKPPKFP